MLSDNDLELLSAYLDGALSETERAALETRLQTDAELRRELARLRATVALVGTLPTLAAPRDFSLTRRMVRRPSLLTSAAFSALSTAAAVILLVIGVALFRAPEQMPSALTAPSQVVAVPTSVLPPGEQTVEDTVGREIGASSPGEDTRDQGAQQPQEETDGLLLSAPTGTPQPSQQFLFSAAVEPTQTPLLDEAQANAALADTTADQQRSEVAPQAASGAVAEAPLPAATLLPTATVTETPTATSTNTPSPTNTLSPTATPTLVPTATAVPGAPAPSAAETNVAAVGLIALALILFGVALVTTLARRR